MKSMISRLLSCVLASALLIICIPVGIEDNLKANGASTEEYIYSFLTQRLGYNSGVACGFLANIYRESSFNPTSDNGYAYGLIQWEGGRRTQLKAFCQANGYDMSSIDAQLLFIQHELEGDESGCASSILNQPATAQGAYDAAYNICYNYERPANKAWKSDDRGKIARDTYWPMFGENIVTDEPIAPYPRPSGSPYVEKGSKGLYVKWVQYTLGVQLGYNIGSAGVDGDFGAGTDSAVKAFQRDNGLEVDGQVGSETINKIVEKVHEKLNPPDPTPSGPIMSTGAGKTLPDGDYYIFSHLNPNYYLDIDGSALPAEKGTNVSMWTASTGTLPPECDVWTLKYLDNGFYKIMQKGTNLCLDVKGGSQLRGTNVQVWTEHSDTPEQWSISATDTGYKIQARCGSYCLDVSGGKITSGTNVQVWESNDSNAQRFGFIPYGASIGQTIEDGIYTIQSAANNDYCLDVQGRDSTVYQKETNVQLWNVDDCNDTFRVEYLGDGYYSICESVSGLALDIVDKGAGGYLNKNNNIQVFTNNKTRNQKWIIRDAGDGYYNIISAYSGYSVDLDGGVAEQRRNIRQHYYNTSNAQKWKFAAPIEKPQSSVLIADKTSLLAGEEISFTVESDTATNYVISVEKGNEKVISQDMPNGNLSLYFSDVGEYTAFVTVSNIMGSTDSEKIKFTVTSNITLHVGETYQLRLGSERLTYKSHNTDVATVTNDGIITATKEGTTILSVVTTDSDVIQYTLKVAKQSVEGDCNNDGIFDVADVVLLQKWLLAVPDTNIANWQAADLCKDGKLDVFDLVMMKRRLIYG